MIFSAVVSVQRVEQSNVPQQQQQVAGAPQMTYPAAPVRYYTPEYMSQRMYSFFISLLADTFSFLKLIATTQSPMHLQQIQFCYPFNPSGIIQATTAPVGGVGTPQNIMIPSTGASGGPSTQTQSPMFYPGIYTGTY